MLTCDLDSSTCDWVIEYPVVLKVFTQLEIEYTCGGKSLEYECRRQRLDPQVLLQRLQAEIDAAPRDKAESGKSAAVASEGGRLQSLVGYHTDEQGHWVGELSCGHFQHVRHEPPWMNRSWVTHEAGRKAMLGFTLACKKCVEGAPPD
ncbi:MAG: DUF3565 domain-containing protein [Planctomycetales bacterium]|nr:DUF3565 domain-containing protein [Planctomycetales bacterium]